MPLTLLTGTVTRPQALSESRPNGLVFHGTVIRKCANPGCAAIFRYLHEGKLFKFEMRSLDQPTIETSGADQKERPSHEIEWFWLCDSCASTMTLVRGPSTHDVVIVSLPDSPQRGDDAGGTSTDVRSDQP
jgi:hypothetical protein